MNLVEVPHGGWFSHEFSNAFIERTLKEQIGTCSSRATFVLERRPLAKNGRRIEINVRASIGHRRSPFQLCKFMPSDGASPVASGPLGATGAHDQANRDAADHALQMGIQER
jgi:hypothetical protein